MEAFAYKPSQVAGKNLSDNGSVENINEEFLVSAIAAYLVTKEDRWDQWIDAREFSAAIPNLDLGPYNGLLQAVLENQPAVLADQLMLWARQNLVHIGTGTTPKFIMTPELLNFYHQFAA